MKDAGAPRLKLPYKPDADIGGHRFAFDNGLGSK
jgi:hypothetical protein